MRLKDVAHINRHVFAEATDPAYSFRYIDISAVDSRGGMTVPDELTTFDTAPSRARRLAPPGSTVVSTVRTYLRAVARVPETDEPLVFSTGFAVVEAKPVVDERFLAYLCRSDPFIDEVVARSVGVSYPAINPGDLGSIGVTLPDLDEQRRLANFLDAETARTDRLVELRTSQLDSVSAHLRSHLSQVADVLHARYGTVKVRHVLQKIEQGWSPQCEDRPAAEGEWGVVKAGCVNGGVFNPGQHKTLPAEIDPEYRYRLRAGDLLMSRASGSVDLIGSIGVLPDDLSPQLLLCDKIYRLRMDRTRMTPHFVALMLSTHQVREEIKLGISGADGMANNLPTATVTNLPLPDAPLAEQARVVGELHDHRETARIAKQTLADQLALIAKRRQALITAAVTGQIDVSTARGLSASGGAAV
ncbi:restriction endonuclease subunit S [Streptomyces sp. NPDC059479]|uniref:restriction endonuclease subunit S n=1 Tax=Streptomyces sp. NPDC059479 TaxID=3346848 RepID=UPI0036B4ED6C